MQMEEVKGAAAGQQAASEAQAPKQGLFSRILSFASGSKSKAKASPQRELDIDRNLSCEEMDSDDLGGDLNLSEDEGGQEERVFRKQYKAQKRVETRSKAANVYRQEFDTNVFEVALDCLANKGQLATGDAEICPKCQAVFNSTSTITEIDGN